MGKIKLCGLLLMGGLLLLVSSCLDSDDNEVDDWTLSNAQIASFSLSNDSIEGLSSVKFTIDQLNNKIYNKDSMPYGTNLDEKILVKVGYDSSYGAMNILFVEQATNDSIWGVSDSIDFSAPVMITVYSYDGSSTKTYEAKLNVHQVNPDTMVWSKYADIMSGKTFQDMKVLLYDRFYYMYVSENSGYNLYKSPVSDMMNWEKLTLSDFPDKAILSQITELEGDLYVISEDGNLFYSTDGQAWSQVDNYNDMPIKTLLGSLPASTITGRSSVLCCIAVADGVLRFVSIDKYNTYTLGGEVPATFPLSGFGNFNYETMYYPRLVLASGRDSKNNLSDKAWATMNGTTWASLSNAEATFSSREGAAVSYYDDCFFVVGGIDPSGVALNDIFYSKDHGVTWIDTVYVMAEEYTARGFSSVIIDKDNYMLLFGGKAGNDANVLNELWRGRINRLGFEEE
ncbi:MAG: DUF6242 domain-containing protein [Tannerella sp.]|jgi:hypothetical protein|nr:DUF6242 domain-containing protein [Tannerella sp.]